MQPTEIVRAVAYVFIGAVAMLFSVRMYVRARREAASFAIPPHWFDIVAIYMSGISFWAIGLGIRYMMAPFTTPHTRWLWGWFYLTYAVCASALAVCFWAKPRRRIPPSEVPVLPTPEDL